MTNAPTNAASAEVTAIDTQARGPLLLLLGSGILWLVVSGVLALITSIQQHSPGFLSDCAFITHGRAQALRETVFVYGWAANVGLGVALWVLGRLGGSPLRATNWTIAGTIFWNLGVSAGLVGIATGDMTSFSLLQLPRYVQPLLVFAYGSISIAGVLAWSGRRNAGMFAAQWYALAALFLFPWLLIGAQAVLLWMPVRGVVQAISAGWFTQGAWSMWLAPLALAGAYYVVPKASGRLLPTYESAPLAFWTLIFLGAWTGGRHLIGGPVPAWVATMAVVANALLLFHYLVVWLNFRPVWAAEGSAMKFIRFGTVAYVLAGVIDLFVSFRGIAVRSQFTFLGSSLEQLAIYGGLSMLFFGALTFMVPRLTGTPWASAALASGHRVLVMVGVAVSVLVLAYAGWVQGGALLAKDAALGDILLSLRGPLLINTAAQATLLAANLLLLVNFSRSVCACLCDKTPAQSIFRAPAKMEAHAS